MMTIKQAKKVILATSAVFLSACSAITQYTAPGTYQGTLPCIDCDKIDATLTLNKDKSYKYDTIYFKGAETFKYNEKGNYSWDKTKTNVIALDENSANVKFQVNSDYVEMTDANGNVAVNSKNNYKLYKVNTTQATESATTEATQSTTK